MRPWSVLAMVSLGACSVEAGRADVPGTYVMNHGRAADTLWIKPEGAYSHSYAYPGRAATVRHGSWTWSNEEFASIELDDFVMHSRRESFPEAFRDQGGVWPAGVDRSLVTGAIFIPVDEDTGWAYMRVSAELLGSGGGGPGGPAGAPGR